jgi:hypothetical protein
LLKLQSTQFVYASKLFNFLKIAGCINKIAVVAKAGIMQNGNVVNKNTFDGSETLFNHPLKLAKAIKDQFKIIFYQSCTPYFSKGSHQKQFHKILEANFPNYISRFGLYIFSQHFVFKKYECKSITISVELKNLALITFPY